MTVEKDHVFHRNFHYNYPLIEKAEGIYLYDESGQQYMDASSGAVAVSVGHGNKEIIEAVAKQAEKVAFVHTLRFETEIQHHLSRLIASIAPDTLDTVYFTSGGAEANESAFKLARQYHIGHGKQKKTKIMSHWNSYHGNTMWTLSAGGDNNRRSLYEAELHEGTVHVLPPYRRGRPSSEGMTPEEFGEACLKEIEETIIREDPETISAFIVEPITGSQIAALVPPDNYLKGIRKLCQTYDILMIADEVMTGFGRTGEMFAVDHWQVVPDIITFAKGVSSAYLPLGGMIVSDGIVKVIKEEWDGKFAHGFTFSGHPLSLAAAKANIEYILKHDLVKKAKRQGEYLNGQLRKLAETWSFTGEVRGKGLLAGFEMVKDQMSNMAFESEFQAAEKFNALSLKNGAVLYPGQGQVKGEKFDHILLGPPLTITTQEIDKLITILEQNCSEFSELIKSTV
ncbi:Adenosylmethionine-8-amino-7-oxononanoate aminotransferase [Salipaludibacillus aurantiacus]|uniref:Adenosylmethionine-8-amino-7-oxononanoate aminotransferase n=1 Tax=Salipaludibacillus aurantiacus TaxID=1601833 RepID=A0A1H9UQ50_9BACI|nr:Adenosylmethionine-8-amino-7-oxononanoate aminotransferase [Salipaludibacillus aurantiacus]